MMVNVIGCAGGSIEFDTKYEVIWLRFAFVFGVIDNEFSVIDTEFNFCMIVDKLLVFNVFDKVKTD